MPAARRRPAAWTAGEITSGDPAVPEARTVLSPSIDHPFESGEVGPSCCRTRPGSTSARPDCPVLSGSVNAGWARRALSSTSQQRAGPQERRTEMAHNVDGVWSLVQSNGFVVTVAVEQPHDASGHLADGTLNGAAKIPGLFDMPIAETNLTGMLRGDDFEFAPTGPTRPRASTRGVSTRPGGPWASPSTGPTRAATPPGSVRTNSEHPGTHAAGSSEFFCQIFRVNPLVKVSTSLTVSSTTASVDSSAQSAAVLEISERISVQY